MSADVWHTLVPRVGFPNTGGRQYGAVASGLAGIAAVGRVFHFLDASAVLLLAAAADPRWRERACADSVWRARAEREDVAGKAAAFEVEATPPEGESLAFCARVLALKGHPMRDEDNEASGAPDTDGGIRTAVGDWLADPVETKAKYGPIASWDTSGVTNMDWLFHRMKDFNEDLSGWNVSSVTSMVCMFEGATSFNGDLSAWNVSSVKDMGCMFKGATSFDRQLGGAWSTSTANRLRMFSNSPGTIVGMTKDANGSIS